MSAPSKISIKRRISDLPPDALFLESSKKRRNTSLHYVRQKPASNHQVEKSTTSRPRTAQTGAPARSIKQRSQKRTFHLNRIPETKGEKQRRNEDDMAQFEEEKPEVVDHVVSNGYSDDISQQENVSTHSALQKPPGRSAATVQPTALATPTGLPPETQVSNEIAEILHQDALDEVKREAKLKSQVQPKVSSSRSRELHRQRRATNASVASAATQDAMDIDDEKGYVYDTYILAPTLGLGATEADTRGEFSNVGYLVITEEDRSLWETYIEDDPSDKDWNSDDEDENAEDYYGADYPEDELASDDEFDRNAYGYRQRGGSDDEEWDAETGNSSGEDEYDRMMNPFRSKSGGRLDKYLYPNAQAND